jgi:exo-beta-1,3-glucanase (GH17 family)
MTKTILVLAANPKDTPQLRLDEEAREIRRGLERAQKRDEYVLEHETAVRPSDVRRALLDCRPSIVHFCGHGTGLEGIAFEDEAGNAIPASSQALAGLFKLFADTVDCVVLNACYTESQAEAIAEHVPYVVGMKRAISDVVAIEFAVAFYDAIGAGETIEFAYRLACNAITWSGMPEHLAPVLKSPKPGQWPREGSIATPQADGATPQGLDKSEAGATGISLSLIRIFLAAPDDVQPERQAVFNAVRSLNDELAAGLGFELKVVTSEMSRTDSSGAPYYQIPDHDIFVGILWTRFGAETTGAGSGTEREFSCPLENRAEASRVLLYFCNRPIPFPTSEEDLRELERVRQFRDTCVSEVAHTVYGNSPAFERSLRRHLVRFLLERSRTYELTPEPAWMQLRPSALERVFMESHWIGYTPTEFDPDIGLYPDESSIEADLRTLASGPFRGVITFGSYNTGAKIPEIARRVGLRGVIMGVYDPRSLEELQLAIAASDFVDGYCVGHMGLHEGRYNQADLLGAIRQVRAGTEKPVSTTESLDSLLSHEQLVDSVDWLFPDVHHYWHEGSTPELAFAELSEILETLESRANRGRRDKTVVLKMISYPSAGAPGLTPENQAGFFSRVWSRLRNAVNNRAQVYLSFFAAFDNSWKIPERRWGAGELSTGLYDITRAPKPAVKEFGRYQ